jgi:hypothetical protein
MTGTRLIYLYIISAWVVINRLFQRESKMAWTLFVYCGRFSVSIIS